MKAGNKLTKKEQPKSDNANGKKLTNSEESSALTTPEIMARSRKSLEGFSTGNDDEKDQQIGLMTEHFRQQQRAKGTRGTKRSSKRDPRTTTSNIYSLQRN